MASRTLAPPAPPLALVRAIPAWVWLAGIVVASAVVHYGLGRRMIAPWIFVDELIYSELAKSFAATGEFEIRGVPVTGYGLVYPVLISPAYFLFDSLPSAYAAAKAINAVVISLAAVPAYLLGRRVLTAPGALIAAVLAVALPSLLYAGTIMTENAFYPVFLLFALALVAALERPTPWRVLFVLAAGGLAYATRAQAVVLFPALLTAPLIVVAYRRERLRELAAFRWLYAIPAGAFLLVVAVELARGRSWIDFLGAYRGAGEVSYELEPAARWLLYHVAELDLSLGFFPFAALLLVASLGRRLERRDQAFLGAALSLAGWLVLEVSVFASRHALRVEERNMFYAAPLFLIALVLWIERGMPRPRLPTAAVGLVAAALPAFLPFTTLITVSALSDTFGLLPWWDVHEWGIALEELWSAALLAGAVAMLLFVLLPRRLGLLLPGLVLAFFVVTAQPVEERTRAASIGALFQGVTRPERDWIDRSLPEGATVAAIYSGRRDPMTVVENEFFSRSVEPVYTLGPPLPGTLPATPLTLDLESGLLLDPDGSPVVAEHALVDDSVPLGGPVVARDWRKGLFVREVGGPLWTTHRTEGVYEDGWSEGVVTYTRYRCRGGTLAVELESDPSLFDRPQRVLAAYGGSAVARGVIPRTEPGFLTVPLRPSGGRCVVRFTILPTAVPSRVRPGSDDTRALGTHFRRVTYQP